MCDIDDHSLADICARHPAVMAAWRFGSTWSGGENATSDVDLGVLFANPPALEQLCDLRHDLQQVATPREIDLIPLNQAGVLLRFAAIDGLPLFCRDPEFRAGFVSLTAREYEDETAFLARALIHSHASRGSDFP